jgi:hypothetical protein
MRHADTQAFTDPAYNHSTIFRPQRNGTDGCSKGPISNVPMKLWPILAGPGLGYHFTDEWSVLMGFAFADADGVRSHSSKSTLRPYRLGADYVNGRVNIRRALRTGFVSPTISAGIDWNNFHTYLPGAPPRVYHGPSSYSMYWWCMTGVPTYGQALSGSVGVDVRWHQSADMFPELLWGNFSSDAGTGQFDLLALQIGGQLQ